MKLAVDLNEAMRSLIGRMCKYERRTRFHDLIVLFVAFRENPDNFRDGDLIGICLHDAANRAREGRIEHRWLVDVAAWIPIA